MKKKFFDPEAQIIELLVKDIVTTSGEDIIVDDDGNIVEPDVEFGL